MYNNTYTRFRKKADVTSDFAGAVVGNNITSPIHPSLPLITGFGGLTHGLFSETPSLEDIKELDEHPAPAYIPGVGTSRLWRRKRALRSLLKDKPGRFNIPISELTGMFGNMALTTTLGGLLGGKEGLAAGLGVGAGGLALGTLAPLFTKRRSLEDQYGVENSKTRAVLRHLIPGLAAYDYFKGLGATRNLSGDPDEIRAQAKKVREKNKKDNKKSLDDILNGKHTAKDVEIVVNHNIERSEAERDAKIEAAKREYEKGNIEKAKEMYLEAIGPVGRKYLEYFASQG